MQQDSSPPSHQHLRAFGFGAAVVQVLLAGVTFVWATSLITNIVGVEVLPPSGYTLRGLVDLDQVGGVLAQHPGWTISATSLRIQFEDPFFGLEIWNHASRLLLGGLGLWFCVTVRGFVRTALEQTAFRKENALRFRKLGRIATIAWLWTGVCEIINAAVVAPHLGLSELVDPLFIGMSWIFHPILALALSMFASSEILKTGSALKEDADLTV